MWLVLAMALAVNDPVGQMSVQFHAAVDHYKARRHTAAASAFARAYELYSAAPLLFDEALAHARAGDGERARGALGRYLALLPDDEARAAERRAYEAAVAVPSPTDLRGVVVIDADPAAQLELDGRVLGLSPWSGSLPDGKHQLTVASEGCKEITKEIVVQPLSVQSVRVAITGCSP